MKHKASISEKASYLHSAILSSNDGLITTFAVVAGSLGANLDPGVIVILGMANLFADGFSMASGNYLGAKSEQEYQEANTKRVFRGSPAVLNSLVTFFAFLIVGILPIIPYLLKIGNQFEISVSIMAVSLFGIGYIQGKYTKRNPLYTGIRSLVMGGIAASVAYIVGDLLKGWA